MFPIPWNKAFRKKDGTLVNMEDIAEGGGSDLPEHSSADAGKVLGVTDNNSLAWVAGGSLHLYLVTTNQLIAKKMYVLTTVEDDITTYEKLKTALTTGFGFVVSGGVSGGAKVPIYARFLNDGTMTNIAIYCTKDSASDDMWTINGLLNYATVSSTKIF